MYMFQNNHSPSAIDTFQKVPVSLVLPALCSDRDWARCAQRLSQQFENRKDAFAGVNISLLMSRFAIHSSSLAQALGNRQEEKHKMPGWDLSMIVARLIAPYVLIVDRFLLKEMTEAPDGKWTLDSLGQLAASTVFSGSPITVYQSPEFVSFTLSGMEPGTLYKIICRMLILFEQGKLEGMAIPFEPRIREQEPESIDPRKLKEAIYSVDQLKGAKAYLLAAVRDFLLVPPCQSFDPYAFSQRDSPQSGGSSLSARNKNQAQSVIGSRKPAPSNAIRPGSGLLFLWHICCIWNFSRKNARYRLLLECFDLLSDNLVYSHNRLFGYIQGSQKFTTSAAPPLVIFEVLMQCLYLEFPDVSSLQLGVISLKGETWKYLISKHLAVVLYAWEHGSTLHDSIS